MGDVLFLAEHWNGRFDAITFQLLSKGRDLADRLGCPLTAVLLGHRLDSLASELAGRGVDRVLVVDDPILETYQPEPFSGTVQAVLESAQPTLFMVGATFWGMEIGPFVAARLNAPYLSNCVAVDLDGANHLVALHPMYNDRVNARLQVGLGSLVVVSVQKGALPTAAVPARPATVAKAAVAVKSGRSRLLRVVQEAAGDADIVDADVVVSVGRGIKDPKHLPLMEELARSLGAALACSRPLVDAGWMPSGQQVGMSGKTVQPKVYLAFGISGASQHLAGMKDSPCIIAVNTDPAASIFRVAHYGVVGDLFAVVPALIEEAKRRRGSEAASHA